MDLKKETRVLETYEKGLQALSIIQVRKKHVHAEENQNRHEIGIFTARKSYPHGVPGPASGLGPGLPWCGPCHICPR